MKSNFRLACKRHLKYPLLCLITLFIVLAPHAKAQERFSDAVGPVTVQEVTAITR